MPNSQTPALHANQAHHADVLIVTVTQTEGQAVIDAFLAATGQKSIPLIIGERTYRDLGTVGGARVWMAISEMGSGGVGGSQETVRLALAALAPASVIMVGIAFGVDKKRQAMGRVLVAQQLLPYELQRVGDKDTLSRGDKAHASPRLINWLTQANLDWDDAAGKAKFGLILAGAKLIDNRVFRDQVIALAQEAIGGEMEGEGLYVACHNAKTDWVLVKAICDWADGNKGRNKDANQKLAASNAARFVLHALQTIPLAGRGMSTDERAPTAAGVAIAAGAAGAQVPGQAHLHAQAHAHAHARTQAQAHAQEPERMLAFCDRTEVVRHLDEFLARSAASNKGLLCLVDHIENCAPELMTRIHNELTAADAKSIRLLSSGRNNESYNDAAIFGRHLRPTGIRNDQALMQQVSDDRDEVLLCWHAECCSAWKAAQVQQYVQAAASWLHGLPTAPCKVVLVLVLRHHGQKPPTWLQKLLRRPTLLHHVRRGWQAARDAMAQFDELAICGGPLFLPDYTDVDFRDWVIDMQKQELLASHVIAALKKPEEIKQTFPEPQRTSRFPAMLALLEKHHSPRTPL